MSYQRKLPPLPYCDIRSGHHQLVVEKGRFGTPSTCLLVSTLFLFSHELMAAKFTMTPYTGGETPTVMTTADDGTTTLSATRSDSANFAGVASGFLDPGIMGGAVAYTVTFNVPITISSLQIGEFTNNSTSNPYVMTPNVGTPWSIPDNDGAIVGAIATHTPSDWIAVTSLTYSYSVNNWRVGIDNLVFTVALPPTITSASYDAGTGTLAVNAPNMTTGDSIDVSKLTLTGKDGGTYTLTSNNVTATSASAFSVTLNATDKSGVNALLNKNGPSASSSTTYNLAAATNWNVTKSSPADLIGNGITVSGVVNAAPSISGTPPTSVAQGSAYSFTPVVTDTENDALTFSITNQPVWANFSTTSGAITGTPNSSQLGVTSGIVISVTDNINGLVSLPAFDLTVSQPQTDTDGDTIPDFQEAIDGTNPNDVADYRDVIAPSLSAPADIIVDATGLFTLLTPTQLQSNSQANASDNVDGAACCSPTVPALNNGKARLVPGLNRVVWRAEDRKGNSALATQNVFVRPLVSLGKDAIVAEGSQASIQFLLNGKAPFYPFTVPYVIDAGSTADSGDHNLVQGVVTFQNNETRVLLDVSFTADSASESDETLIVRLDDRTNDAADLADGFNADIFDINSGAKAQQTITITEGNVTPVITLQVQQGGSSTILIGRNSGLARIAATVVDGNPGDTLTLDWSASDTRLVDTDSDQASLSFDPANLSPGRYSAELTATDSAGATDTRSIDFLVVETLPTLDSAQDSDNDGIDDLTEGTADTDGDGIADYLDNISELNVLPVSVDVTDEFLVECDPGVLCRLGKYSLLGESGGAGLSANDLAAQDDLTRDAEFDLLGDIYDFKVQGLDIPGQQVQVVLPLRVAIPEAAVYRKFQDGLWTNFVEDAANELQSSQGDLGSCPPPGDASWEAGLIPGYFCLQLTLEDGGPNDADGKVNGAVDDPGALAVSSDRVIKSGGGSVGWGLLLVLIAAGISNRRLAKPLAAASKRTGYHVPSILALAVGGACLLPPEAANAQDWQSLAGKSFVELDLYSATGSQGKQDFRRDMAREGVQVDIDSYDVSRVAYQLAVGYVVNPMATVLVGYVNLGDVEVDFTTSTNDGDTLQGALEESYPISGHGLSLAYRYQHALANKLSVFGDAGLLFWKSTVDASGTSSDPDIDGGVDPLLAVGLDYQLTEQITAGLKYRYQRLDDQRVNGLGVVVRVGF